MRWDFNVLVNLAHLLTQLITVVYDLQYIQSENNVFIFTYELLNRENEKYIDKRYAVLCLQIVTHQIHIHHSAHCLIHSTMCMEYIPTTTNRHEPICIYCRCIHQLHWPCHLWGESFLRDRCPGLSG